MEDLIEVAAKAVEEILFFDSSHGSVNNGPIVRFNDGTFVHLISYKTAQAALAAV